MARKFLYFFTFCVVLFFAGRVVLSFYPEASTRLAFRPGIAFEPQPALPALAYADSALWIARPGLSGDPAHWNPPGAAPARPLHVAVFFIHPTTHFDRRHWNAPLDDFESRRLAETVVRAYASAFAGAEQLWVPRYRQVTLGAFLSDSKDAEQAFDLAHGDVLAAFDAFLASVPKDMPIVLAGHSQGAWHLRRLLEERVAGTPLAQRIAAVYAIGWGISPQHDLPKMGLPACARPADSGCVVSWLSFGEDGDPAMMFRAAARRGALDGQSLEGAAYLCTNPLTGSVGGSAPASSNLGALILNPAFLGGAIKPGLTGAHCRADGALMLDGQPAMGPLVFPGENYHAYDIPLFWVNLRDDFGRRVVAWQAGR
jgi:hypothetical protein